METNVERIAEVITAHDFRHNTLDCICHEWELGVDDPYAERHAAHAVHVAEQLAAAGFGHIPTALQVRGVSAFVFGPECRDDKHGSCSGDALDEVTDSVVGCSCDCHERFCPTCFAGMESSEHHEKCGP